MPPKNTFFTSLSTNLSSIWDDAASPYTFLSTPNSLPPKFDMEIRRPQTTKPALSMGSVNSLSSPERFLNPRYCDQWDLPIAMDDTKQFEHCHDTTVSVFPYYIF